MGGVRGGGVIVPPRPGATGAIGIALLAQEQFAREGVSSRSASLIAGSVEPSMALHPANIRDDTEQVKHSTRGQRLQIFPREDVPLQRWELDIVDGCFG